MICGPTQKSIVLQAGKNFKILLLWPLKSKMSTRNYSIHNLAINRLWYVSQSTQPKKKKWKKNKKIPQLNAFISWRNSNLFVKVSHTIRHELVHILMKTLRFSNHTLSVVTPDPLFSPLHSILFIVSFVCKINFRFVFAVFLTGGISFTPPSYHFHILIDSKVLECDKTTMTIT